MRQLYEQYVASVGRDLTFLGVPSSDLDDARQEVFLVVSRKLSDYEERGSMRAWLFSICLRVAQRRRRLLLRRRELHAAYDYPEQVVDPTQHERVMEHEALALGCRLLSELPPEQRDVFWLYEVEDLSMPEVARVLGCPLQTAYSRLRKARERVLAAVARAPADRPQHSHGEMSRADRATPRAGVESQTVRSEDGGR